MKHSINLRRLVLLLFLTMCSFDLLAQVVVTGVVTDEDGNTLPGVNVFEKGTTNGTITDLDGKYRVSVASGATLVFSFVGYDNQEFSVSGTKAINVVLKENSKEIEEVVVVGYGQQRKASVVGAITQTDSKTIERAAGISDLSTALTGNLPGVVTVASANGGQPGMEATDITIRGANSFNSNNVLVLVDGIERPMSSVDPASVKNVSVLKDASATAVFGVKGANGVILIETKRGNEGKAQINVAYSTTLKTVSKLPGKYDSYDAYRYRNIAVEHQLNIAPTTFSYIRTQEYINNYRPSDPNVTDEYGNKLYERFPNVDWQDILFKNVAISHNANMNISGGNKYVRYFTAADWANEGDMFDVWSSNRGYQSGYDYNRFNVRSNLDFSLTKTTVFKVNLAGSIACRHSPWAGGDGGEWQQQQKWSGAYNMAPDIYLPKYSDGSWGYDGSGMYANASNSAEGVAIHGINSTTTSKITTDFILEQNLDFLTKGLSFRGSVSWDNNFQESGRGIWDEYKGTAHKWIDPLTGIVKSDQTSDRTSGLEPEANAVGWERRSGGQDNWALNRSVNYQLQFNWNRNFDKHFLTAMGLFQRNEGTYGEDYTNYREDWVFRVTYNWNDKYFCEYNGAYNGSEKFAPEYRFAFFNSGAIGWNIHNEPFMEFLKDKKILDQLKVRFSYGQIGDDGFTNQRWLYATEWEADNKVPMSETGSSSNYIRYKEKKLGNPDIHWETVTKMNFGIDYGFFNGLVSGSVEFFKDKRDDCVVMSFSTIPEYFGTSRAPLNKGKVESKGYEVDMRIRKDFGKLHTWGNFNLSHSENKIIVRDDAELLPAYRKEAGYQVGQLRTYVDNGRITNYDQLIAATPTYQYQDQRLMGDYTFIDFNGDGAITQDDQIPYGYAANRPANTYNATIGADYKGLGFFLQFYGVNNVMRDVNMNSFGGKFLTVFDQGTWYSEDPSSADIATPRYDSNMFDTGTQFWSDASYVRLRTAEISYTFNKLNVGKFTFSNVKIYFNGNNLWMWTRLPDDRETVGNGWSAGGGAYPAVKRFTFGLKFSL
ncbi:MAG: SusC/RagA family TonB-linked outer membrane protein [Bacteroidales bacterium]|nr:SusC/RagA family TonB-linked outer membrane protein [Bacteroidales bacterium]